jgi:gluconate 2-dehydrogenase gamma chain
MTEDRLSRRRLLAGTAVAGAAAAVPRSACAQDHPHDHAHAEGRAPAHAQAHAPGAQPAATQPGVLFFFNDEEARFIEAAVDRLIPADPQWGGAKEAGVLAFIDRQLASAYGAGARMYLKGPWDPTAPAEQGYQLRHTPAELYRIGVEETRAHCRQAFGGREFWTLGDAAIDQVLKGLETDEIKLPSVPGPVFFETLLANTIEGFFADPAYGGNRDMVSWRMIGFPGAYAAYVDLVERYDAPYTREPISFADQSARLSHLHAHDPSSN